MARKITFEDKTNKRAIINRTQQVCAEDLNEIKEVVNANADAQGTITEQGGFAGGDNASSVAGGAVGKGTYTTSGGAVGNEAKAKAGFAGGQNSNAGNGVAIGKLAKIPESDLSTKTVQLGEGTNSNPNTLQYGDVTVVDENGKIPINSVEYMSKDDTSSYININNDLRITRGNFYMYGCMEVVNSIDCHNSISGSTLYSSGQGLTPDSLTRKDYVDRVVPSSGSVRLNDGEVVKDNVIGVDYVIDKWDTGCYEFALPDYSYAPINIVATVTGDTPGICIVGESLNGYPMIRVYNMNGEIADLPFTYMAMY